MDSDPKVKEIPEEIRAACRCGQYDVAIIDALRPIAESGNSEAQYLLGLALLPLDPDAGLEWIRRAAEQEHEEARIRLVTHLYGNVLG